MMVIPHSVSDPRCLPSPGDLTLAASLIGVAVLSGFYIDANRPDTIAPSTWWHWVLIASPPTLVAFRRTAPIAVTMAATSAQTLIWVTNLPEVLLPIIVILYSAASDAGERGLRAAIAASAALTVVTGIGVRIADDVSAYQLPLIVLTCGTAVALGVNANRQRRTAEELAAQVTEVWVRSEHERARAISEERSHIARELHDIIGHTLSVIAVRAEAADRTAHNRPDDTRQAVADIATSARAALDQTRRVLAGLRETTPAALTPAPDLTATRRLVTDLAHAGVTATLAEQGCNDHQPPAVVAASAHRIVQESLTNAIKHGGTGVTIDVELTCSPTALDIVITNSVTPNHDTSPTDVDGTGLAGMAERATVLGGTLHAHRSDNRFIVTATLPTRTDTTAGPEQ